MSSDSDDLDEDELLQMALKEQSTRNLNYQKPQSTTSSARKPVANYVQHPGQMATGSSSQGAGNSRGAARKASMDDDEDSEVEMLSISSGDEDEGKDSRGGGGGRSKGRVKEEEVDWDGEEPDCWKRVDEAELARRVRGMRETRIAPVAEKFETKASAAPGKIALNTLQSFPRGSECVDPLGLGIIDNKTLRLITDTSESSPSPSGRGSLDSSLREKLMYFSDNFDAKLFISRIHQETSSADMEAGALALKTDLKGRTQQRKQLVKDNFDCFVSCKTTIDDIESKLRRNEEDPEGSGTTHLYNCMKGVNSLAIRAFEPLFERQAQAEKIRSVQGMLQRFRTLFNLPSTIRASIGKGEYDLAVREYKKAKSIALPSHLNILKRVHEEVEKVMLELKGMLYKSMEEPQVDVTSLENTVRLLLELDPESDPVWHYLNVQNQKIRGLLEKCTSDHEAQLESLHSAIRERALSDAKWKQIQRNLYQSSDANHLPGNIELPVDLQPMDLNGEEIDALRGRYIRRLTAVLIHHVPAFWKVALSVFSGKFAKSSQVSDSSAIRSEEKDGDRKYSTHSLDEVAVMLRNTISLYEAKVLNTFHELEESNTLQQHMSAAIKEISKAAQAFEAKESAPPAAVLALKSLQAEVIKIYTLRLCSWMRASTERITRDETWVPVSVLERNKSPYTISYLPLSFRSVLASAMDQINLMIQSLKSEVKKSPDMFGQLQEIQESVRLAFLNSFLDFAAHLERIGSDLAQKKSNKEKSYMQNGYSNEQEEASDHPGSIVDPHQRLLMVLSNVAYCKDELSQELYKKYKYIWLQSVEKEEDTDIQDLVTSFSGLEETVLEQYTFAKANLIRTAGMNYLLDSGMQWGSAPAVKGVRDAAVELLHTLVSVHAEVFAGAQPLLEKTLGILVEGLIDTFISLFHENQTKEFRLLDANGFCQFMLELEYFETILNPYLTADARESLKSLDGVLLEKATESISEASEVPGHQRRSTRGSEEADERQQGLAVSPDDLIALAQQCSSEFLQAELERTRLNTSCFVEAITRGSAVPEPTKAPYASYRGSMDSPSRNFRGTKAVSVPSPSFSRHRHR